MRGARQEPAFSWGRERGTRLTPSLYVLFGSLLCRGRPSGRPLGVSSAALHRCFIHVLSMDNLGTYSRFSACSVPVPASQIRLRIEVRLCGAACVCGIGRGRLAV